MGHATCAYLGDLLDLTYIYEAIDVADVRIIVHNAMMESALAIAKSYAMPMEELCLHIEDLLYRFTNAALLDTCARVGGDPKRKLSPHDRLVGAANTALAEGIFPSYVSVGIAAALHRFIGESDNRDFSLQNAKAVLKDIANLKEGCELYDYILEVYGRIQSGCNVSELLCYADETKAKYRHDVF